MLWQDFLLCFLKYIRHNMQQQLLSSTDVYRSGRIRRQNRISCPFFDFLFDFSVQIWYNGFISRGKLPEKTVYSLTETGEKEFERLMGEISCSPVNIFLDFNAVIVNLDSVSSEQKAEYIGNIDKSISELKTTLEENPRIKENNSNIPATGMAVLYQQYALVVAIENWINEMKNKFSD